MARAEIRIIGVGQNDLFLIKAQPVLTDGVEMCIRDSPQIVYQIALSEGKICGFVSVHIQKLLHHTAPIAEIQELVVDEKCRGQGVGKLLFGKAKEIAAKAGCPQLECACNQRRTASHAFYKKQGMTCLLYTSKTFNYDLQRDF